MRGAEEDPFYLATLIGILIELGDLDRADRCFQAWPEPRTGYEYWLTQGKVLQEIRAQYREASEAYARAFGEWPGPIDWRTRNRMATCLAHLQDREGAARQREQAKVIEDLMEEKVHQPLRLALGSLSDPQQMQKLVDFYTKLGRPREAAAWSDHIAWLKSKATGQRDLGSPTDH